MARRWFWPSPPPVPAGVPLTASLRRRPRFASPPISIPVNVPFTFPVGVTTVNCSASDEGGVGSLTVRVTVTPFMAPPVVTVVDQTVEAMGVVTPVMFVASASDASGPVPVACDPAPGSSFPLGTTAVNCSATNAAGTTTKNLQVTVRDTMPPVILGGKVEVEANAVGGATVVLPWTAKDLASGDLVLPVTCDNVPPASFFPIGTTHLLCHANDGRGNSVSETFEVTVTIEPPKFPGGSCFVVDFREITYFRNQTVLMSSDAAIRAAAGITGAFAPEVWPYRASGGAGYTRSKATLFRLYGFQPSEVGQLIPDADESFTSYMVQYDTEAKGYLHRPRWSGARVRLPGAAPQLRAGGLEGQRSPRGKHASSALAAQRAGHHVDAQLADSEVAATRPPGDDGARTEPGPPWRDRLHRGPAAG